MKFKNLIIPVLFLVVIGGTSALVSLTKSGYFSASSAMEPASTIVSTTAKPGGLGDITTVTVPSPADGKPIEIIIKHEQGDKSASNQETPSAALIGIFWNVATVVLVVVGIYLLISFLRKRNGAGPTSGGSPANHIADKVFGQWINPADMGGNGFADVAGVPEAVRQMEKLARKITEQAEIVRKIRAEATRSGTGNSTVMATNGMMEKLRSMTKKSKFGGEVPQCALLVGPPGTGKTLLVKALAKECNVPVFVTSGSDFVEVFVGLGAERIRRMFKDARYQRPCIIFIDELDAVGRARSAGGANSNAEADQTLNQLLAELQGLNTGNDNFALWIVGATNRIDILDKALLRPGRFTWHIKVDPPHLAGRVSILKLHAKNRQVPLDDSVDFKSIASVLSGLTGADLGNVVNETALFAEELAREQARNLRAKSLVDGRTLTDDEIEAQVKGTVSQEDFFEGLLRHLMGLKLETSLRFDQTLNTVVHEVGHALGIAYERSLGRTDERVRFISIEPRDRALGLTFKTPEGDSFGKTLEHVDADAVCAFGGSAAQLVFLNTKDSGPDNDFEVAAGNIYRAIGRWYGSEKLGPFSLGQRGMSNGTELGEELKNLIDSECISKTKVLYARSWWIMNLFIRSDSVWTMFWELLERKIMREDRFAELFASAMQEVEANPQWKNGELDALLTRVKNDPQSWSAEPLKEETRAYLTERIEQLRTRYAVLDKATNQTEQ